MLTDRDRWEDALSAHGAATKAQVLRVLPVPQAVVFGGPAAVGIIHRLGLDVQDTISQAWGCIE